MKPRDVRNMFQGRNRHRHSSAPAATTSEYVILPSYSCRLMSLSVIFQNSEWEMQVQWWRVQIWWWALWMWIWLRVVRAWARATLWFHQEVVQLEESVSPIFFVLSPLFCEVFSDLNFSPDSPAPDTEAAPAVAHDFDKLNSKGFRFTLSCLCYPWVLSNILLGSWNTCGISPPMKTCPCILQVLIQLLSPNCIAQAECHDNNGLYGTEWGRDWTKVQDWAIYIH